MNCHYLHAIKVWGNNKLLLTNCEVHAGKYLDWSFEVRTKRSEIRSKSWGPHIFQHGPHNWSISALLYSHNQRPKTEAFFKFSTEHTCVFLECSCWKGNFFQFPYLIKSKTCVKIFVIPFDFVYWRRSSISRSNTLFSRSNTALDGPLINQSNRVVLSSYTVKLRPGASDQVKPCDSN